MHRDIIFLGCQGEGEEQIKHDRNIIEALSKHCSYLYFKIPKDMRRILNDASPGDLEIILPVHDIKIIAVLLIPESKNKVYLAGRHFIGYAKT